MNNNKLLTEKLIRLAKNGYNFFNAGKRDQAEKAFQQVLDIEPNNANAIINLMCLNVFMEQNKAGNIKTTSANDFVYQRINQHLKTSYPKEFSQMFPNTFAIETILGCDLKCPECAIGGDFVTRRKGWMKFSQFKIVADKIRPFCKYLYLHIWGEPLLNKDIFEMIKYAITFTKTNISTNGKSMSEEKAEKLIRSGVTDIIFSIDGISQDIYEKYRVGGNIGKAINALKMLQHFNQKYSNKVHIIPQFIVMKHNYQEMDNFRNLCESLGLKPHFKSPYIRNPNSCFSVSDDPRFQRPCYSDITSLKKAMRECGSVRNVFNILLDGTVVACCHDYDKFTNFGNIFDQDVMEIWNSEKYKEFRWRVISGKPPNFCIKHCMSYFLDRPDQSLKVKDKGLSMNKSKSTLTNKKDLKINLCSGSVYIEGYVNVDLHPRSDIVLDLEKNLLPFPDNSADIVACISAINYFSRQRALEIIKDVHRVLKPDGVVRFGTQDLKILAKEYLNKDSEFYFQKLPDGRDRFPGKTKGDKLNEFFYGFQSSGKHCKYVYDYESLEYLFKEAGFSYITQKTYHESLIPEVKQLDNRPEQMFFLEAMKKKPLRTTKMDTSMPAIENDIDRFKEQAFKLWENGEKERSWQILLKVLEIKPEDHETAIKTIHILENYQRYEDVIKLTKEYLKINPHNTEITMIQQNALKNSKNCNEINAQKREKILLNNYNNFLNKIYTDDVHLKACMQWLVKAQDANSGGGVSATYNIGIANWGVDYPETTGYIIPNFICYAKFTNDESYLKRAIDMGDWEIAIQSPEGGAGEPVGVYGLRPRIFNTGQVMIGWLALYEETGNAKYLDATIKAADWIVSNQDDDGKWTKSTYSGPKAYHSRVAWVLLELFSITKNDTYRVSVERSLNWIMAQATHNAWFNNNSLSEPGKPWTHLIGYVLVGLLEIYRMNRNNSQFEPLIHLLSVAAKNIANIYIQIKKKNSPFKMLPGTLDFNWNSVDNWSCITGNAQIEFFLRRMYNDYKDQVLIKAADMLITDIKSCHFIDGITDKNVYGGLPGSYPVYGPYQTYAITNWGVKFFADSLLQRLLPENKQKFLG